MAILRIVILFMLLGCSLAVFGYSESGFSFGLSADRSYIMVGSTPQEVELTTTISGVSGEIRNPVVTLCTNSHGNITRYNTGFSYTDHLSSTTPCRFILFATATAECKKLVAGVETWPVLSASVSICIEVRQIANVPLPFADNIPTHACPVNLVTGDESLSPVTDLAVYNPRGPTAAFTRTFSNTTVKQGSGSPGLAPGWTHQYEMLIEGPEVPGEWDSLTLRYANGASELLTPADNPWLAPPGVSSSSSNASTDGTPFNETTYVPDGSFLASPGSSYLVQGVPSTVTGQWDELTLTDASQTTLTFTLVSTTPEIYRITRVSDRLGHGIDISWDANQYLTSIAQSGVGGETLLTLNYASGQLSSIVDCYDRKVSYTFGAPGQGWSTEELLTVSQIVAANENNPPTLHSYAYVQDPSVSPETPLLASSSTPSPTGTGISTTGFAYYTNGKVETQTDPNGNYSQYVYDVGHTHVETYSAQDVLTTQETYYYNELGLVTGVEDSDNQRTYLSYGDTSNPYQPTLTIAKDGKETSVTYDQYGQLTSSTNARGVTTTLTYDYGDFAFGRLVSIQQGTQTPTTMTYYEPSGLLHTVTSPQPGTTTGSTVTTTFVYDSLGNVTSVVSPGNDAAQTITTTCNYTTDGQYTQNAAIGQPLAITDNLGHVTHYRYDERGNCLSVTDAEGNASEYSYNIADQQVSVTLPASGQSGSGNGYLEKEYLYTGGPLIASRLFDEGDHAQAIRTVNYTYGPFGELLQRAGSGEEVAYQYDARYRTIELHDGNDNVTTYSYDLVGHLTEVTYPGNETVQFTDFDTAGRLLERVDGNSVVTQYEYNDDDGLLTDIIYPASTALNVSFSYDGYGRRTGMSDSTGTQSYSYDELDNPLTVVTTYNGLSARSIGYGYNPDGSRAQMTTPAGNFSYVYDEAGRLASMTNPESKEINWQYLDNDWLAQQTLDNGAYTAYTQNALGQLTRVRNYAQQGSVLLSDYTDLIHDGAGNLLTLTADIQAHSAYSGSTEYLYDAKDQLTAETSDRGTGYSHEFAYDDAGNPTTFKGDTRAYNSNNQRSGTGYAYDGNGNPTSYGGTTLTFDPENRMTAYGTALTAGYRGDGLRAWKEVPVGESTVRTYYLYDGALLLQEMDEDGDITASNTWGVNGLALRNDSRGTVYYLFDPQGSVAHRLDEYGDVQSNDLYDAYGTLLDGGDATDPYGYNAQTGYYRDMETGLMLCTFRYYDPAAGRWVTRDPIGYGGGVNLYGYCGNGPVGRIDPSGKLYWQVARWGYMGGTAMIAIYELYQAKELYDSAAALEKKMKRYFDNKCEDKQESREEFNEWRKDYDPYEQFYDILTSGSLKLIAAVGPAVAGKVIKSIVTGL